ncbi:MAG: hypothetical protein K1X94_37065 [Sandaracinaceae bacterium]|nr:hypothetical protein [Sandaracinaceae bacterium]
MLTRRGLCRGSVAGAILLATGRAASARADVRAPSAELPPAVSGLLREALGLGRALRRGDLTQHAWQERMSTLLASIPAPTIAAALDLPALRARAPRVRRGAAIVTLPFPETLGGDEGAAMRVFFFEGGRTDPPHVHFNSVTTHLVLEGRFRVQHWDRVREEASGFVLRPTHDRELVAGESSSISEERDNGHWHACLDRGVLIDVEQGRLDPSIPPRNRQMVDLSGQRDGEFFAPSLSRAVAMRRYG